jgi:hypothetical protein
MRVRKAQVTMFVILGLVLFSVFAFALYARNSIIMEQTKAKAALILTDALQANSINYYVENCLQQVSTEAIFKITEQGGIIDTSTYIPWQDYFIRENTDSTTTHIMYAIKPNDRCNIVQQQAPQYPYNNARLEELQGIYRHSICRTDELSGFLGKSSLPKLCSYNGPNAYSETPGYFDIACDKLAYSINQKNMQQELTTTIATGLKECVDFKYFEDITGNTILADESGLEVKIIYGLDAVTIQAQYPFTVTVGKRGVITLHEFTHTSPLRLRRIYEYAMNLVQRENTNHLFNIKDDYVFVNKYDPAFKFTITEEACTYQTSCMDDPTNKDYVIFDDIITIEDTLVNLHGKTLTFNFAIRNRVPVLDYIHDPGAGTDFDIKAAEDETITITPRGYDPEGSLVTYRYEGWHEDYLSALDQNCCTTGPTGAIGWIGYCTLENYKECEKPVIDDVTGEPSVPHTWTQSELYQGSYRDAKISLHREDTGIHEVKITAYDDTGLYDFQIIRILVFDLPLAVPVGNNGFTDISANHASIEDPYTLDGSQSRMSTVIHQPIGAYSWKVTDLTINNPEGMFTFDTTKYSIIVPDDVSYDTWVFYDPAGNDITKQPFYANDLQLEGNHLDIQLIVSTEEPYHLFSNPVSIEPPVILHECLPHRNANNPYAYPYNNGFSDYDHNCCLGSTINGEPESIDWGTVADTNKDCFDVPPTRGLLRNLHNTRTYFYGDPSITPPIEDEIVIIDGGSYNYDTINNQAMYENDIFERSFTRFCDDKRGNVCGGRVEIIYSLVQPCPEYTTNTQVRRCTGPSSQVNPLTQCIYYGSSTFESRYVFLNYAARTITPPAPNTPLTVCEPFWRCSGRPSTTTYDPSPLYDASLPSFTPTPGRTYFCQGTCSSSDGSCTTPINCQCSEICGSTCDAATDWRMTGNVCSYSCNTNVNVQANTACNFGGSVTCDATTICNEETNQYNNCQRQRNYDLQYCYTGGSCSASGCTYTNHEILRENFCDHCMDTGVTPGNFCPAPGTSEYGACYTYSEPRRCNTDGTCQGIQATPLAPSVSSCKGQRPSPIEELYDGAYCTPSGIQCCYVTNTDCMTT